MLASDQIYYRWYHVHTLNHGVVAVRIQECFESDKLGKFAVRAMTKRAVEVLIKLHAAGWSHCDYQLKNIMLDNACAASSLSVGNIAARDIVNKTKSWS